MFKSIVNKDNIKMIIVCLVCTILFIFDLFINRMGGTKEKEI